MKHLTYLFGIQTPWHISLPKNFIIAHFGAITFFPQSCGKNVTISHGVTTDNSGKYPGSPRIDNNVVFGANAVVIGDIEIGDGTVNGANAVVNK